MSFDFSFKALLKCHFFIMFNTYPYHFWRQKITKNYKDKYFHRFKPTLKICKIMYPQKYLALRYFT